jgi:hypothetical protein
MAPFPKLNGHTARIALQMIAQLILYQGDVLVLQQGDLAHGYFEQLAEPFWILHRQ